MVVAVARHTEDRQLELDCERAAYAAHVSSLLTHRHATCIPANGSDPSRVTVVAESLDATDQAIEDLAARARSKKLNPEEVQGGTFTITNPGIFGAVYGLPLINQPQVAILGVGAIEKRAVVINDAIAIHPTCHLSLGYDHRLIDGADAGRFLLGLLGWMLRDRPDPDRGRAALHDSLTDHLSPDGVQYASAAWLITAHRT